MRSTLYKVKEVDTKKYFRLLNNIIFHHDKTGGCLYNVFNGDLITIPKDKVLGLIKAENNEPITKNDHFHLYCQKLEEKQLGFFTDKPVYVEKIRLGKSKQMRQILLDKISIKQAHIEITNKCNSNCLFCNNESNLVFRRTGCKRWQNNKESNILSQENWYKIIDELINLDCTELNIIGGEPFLEFDKLKDIVAYSKNAGIKKIVVYTNGFCLTEEHIEFVMKNDLELCVQLLSMKSKTNAFITQKEISIDFNNLLQELKTRQIQFKLLYLISRYNEDEVDETIKTLKENGYKFMMDFLYPYPENDHYSEKFVDKTQNFKNKLTRVSIVNYNLLSNYNCCYHSKIAISQSGEIFPCFMSRGIKLGQLNGKNTIISQLDEQYAIVKVLSKDKIEPCSDCMYRYACIECRAIEMSATGSLYKQKNCSLIEK